VANVAWSFIGLSTVQENQGPDAEMQREGNAEMGYATKGSYNTVRTRYDLIKRGQPCTRRRTTKSPDEK
jgi:hypothetical protein